jgi:hypothetical protein
MAITKRENVLDIAVDRDLELDETSDERFDRTEFAMEVLELLRPSRTTVAVCHGARLRVECGRTWGRPDERWAVLAITPTASRRAITTAVAALARAPRPYALALVQARASAAAEE